MKKIKILSIKPEDIELYQEVVNIDGEAVRIQLIVHWKIEYEILSADTDLLKLPNNYYFDQSETFELDDIVKKTNEEFGKSNGEYFPKGFIHFKTVYFEGE